LVGLVAAQNDATLAQYRARLAERTGVQVSEATVCRTLTRLGLSRQKDLARLGADAPQRRGTPGALRFVPRSIRLGWSSSTKAASTHP
jgi:transposase